jgi:hypothetical protein
LNAFSGHHVTTGVSFREYRSFVQLNYLYSERPTSQCKMKFHHNNNCKTVLVSSLPQLEVSRSTLNKLQCDYE